MTAPRPADLRRLAVVVTPKVLFLQLREASRGAWETLWLVDRAIPNAGDSMRLLSRTGRVVDVTGLDISATAQRLASERPDGIIAFGEPELMSATRIGTLLDLPVNTPQTVERLTNKLSQRSALEVAGIPSPRFWAAEASMSKTTRHDLARTVRYPAIVKPQSGYGSRETRRAIDAETLGRILDENITAPEPADLIIEELIPDGWSRDERPYADFVSVESIVSHGHVSHLAITGRGALHEPFLETGNFIPALLEPALAAEVLALAADAIKALGVVTGATHTEIKLTPQGPRVIEVNGRVGGSIPEIFALATENKHSILNLAGRVAIGEVLRCDRIPTSRVGFSVLLPPPHDARRLLRLDNVDQVGRLPGVDAVVINRRPGDRLDWREGWDGHILMVFGFADNHAGMWQTRQRISEVIQLEYE